MSLNKLFLRITRSTTILSVMILASVSTRSSFAFVSRRTLRSFAGTTNPTCRSRLLTTISSTLGFSSDDTAATAYDDNATPLVNILPRFSQYTLPNVATDVIPLLPDQRLLCFGDVHGDLAALKNFLEIAQVYDRTSQHWTGGNAIVVQCGDVLDRGTEELACLELLADLSRQAVAKGGKLILLYGNHEALNAVGLFQYAYEGGNVEYEQKMGKVVDKTLSSDTWRLQFAGNQPARWAAHEPGGLLANVLMRQMKVAVQVGKTVCVHAGLTKDHLMEYGGLSGMNRQVQEWMEQPSVEFVNSGRYQSVEDVIQSAENRAQISSKQMPNCLGGGIGAESPVWMRDYSHPADLPPKNRHAQKMINDALEELQCDRMVMGHTPQRHINAALEGKAWRVDVGASRGVMGGTPEVLEIIGGEIEQVNVLTRSGRIAGAQRHTMAAIL